MQEFTTDLVGFRAGLPKIKLIWARMNGPVGAAVREGTALCQEG
jgi:hypothetical protein